MQQPLPEMPPMKPVPPMAQSHSEPVERSMSSMRPGASMGSQMAVPLARRLRQMLTMMASGGIVLTLSIGALEMIAKPEFRPTSLLATVEARTELGVMNQKMKLAPGEMILSEADYRTKLAEAERGGQAKAELSFQKQLAVVQANKERVVQAYGALYQRTNQIAQMALQIEMVAQQFRQKMIEMSNAGRNLVLMGLDLACGIGNQEQCEAAKNYRRNMVAESEELTRSDVGEKVRQLLTGIDDPATFITREDQRQNGAPVLSEQ